MTIAETSTPKATHPEIAIFACPSCKGPFANEGGAPLHCPGCKLEILRDRGVLRFLPNQGYTGSFGFQWQKHAKTQLDSCSGLPISRERFFRETGWQPEEMKGKRLLELGSGAGRFTEVALSTGAKVYSLDASEAVFANAESHPDPCLTLLQASLFDQPFLGTPFDYVFCLGVIQHTPDPEAAFRAILKHLRPGGRFCIDVYAAPIAWLHPRHLLRPITRHLKPERLYPMVEKSVDLLLPLSHALHQIPRIGEILARLVPVANWESSLPLATPELRREWSVLDTFDWYSPYYETPQPRWRLARWASAAGIRDYEIASHRGIFVIRGTK